jgi:hypothetical protein
MKIMISFLSLFIIFAGLLPFIGDKIHLPAKGTAYAFILIGLSIAIMVLAIINNMLMGLEKFILFIQGALVLIMAVKSFLPTLLPFIPVEGALYGIIIILIGLAGFIYGVLGMG